MTNEANGNRWSTHAILGLLTALLGVESAGALRGGAATDIEARVSKNAELIRAVADEQRELKYAIGGLTRSVESLTAAVERMPSR